ncbi:MAG: NlpC/P60 family protein [Acidimicrobiales bacterium]
MRVLLALLGALAVAFVSAVPSASADPISDKKAEAARISARIEQLNGTVEQFAEQANAAQIELDGLNGQVAESSQKVAAAQAQVDQHQGELRDYAVDAYVRGGDDNESAATTGAADVSAASQRAGYLAAAAGNRQQIIDTLDATKQDLQVVIDQLNQQRSAAEAKGQAIAGSRAQAQGAVNEQQTLKNQTDGELNQLVAAEQARQEAARQAEAQQRSAAAAATQARPKSAAAAAAGPRPVSGGGGSGGGGGGGEIANPGPASGSASVAVNTALNQVGDPYVYGAAGPDSFDCSGLMMYAWNAAGVSLPHNTNAQYSATRHVSISDLQPGDIVYYNGFGHDGMYIGNGQIVHAPHSGAYVEVVGLYYVGNPIAASRP